MHHERAPQGERHWFDNAIIYHVVTDRFYHAKDDGASGCADPRSMCAGEFHGGNFKGVTEKIRDGWFERLGVNCIWLSAPYEQIRGWVPGGGDIFRYHAFHGYWPLDFTVIESRFGSEADFEHMVGTAHRAGIRIVLDIGMSHVGYPDVLTLNDYAPEALKSGWRQATPGTYRSFIDHGSEAIAGLWGPDWIHGDLPGYLPEGRDDHTGNLHGLPRLRVSNQSHVTPPDFLLNKPGSKVEALPQTTVLGYLVHWLTSWVKKYGIDGFRCDSAKHVPLDAWKALKIAAQDALVEWKEKHPGEAIDQSPFWMTGEVFDHGITRNAYHDNGFDSLINFDFQNDLSSVLHDRIPNHAYAAAHAHFRLDRIYRAYADTLDEFGHDILSYISSHDAGLFDRNRLIEAGTALFLLPGGLQILFGDESGRPAAPDADGLPWYADMNWSAVDHNVLHHWRQLGRFRSRHIALARGAHRCRQAMPYVFSRVDKAGTDRVLVVMGPAHHCVLDVSDLFEDGTMLGDAYGGQTFMVSNGNITVSSRNLLLIEEYCA